MSKAFTNEEIPDEPLLVPRRAPLPVGSPNYVTARGLSALRVELKALEGERARAESLSNDEERTRLITNVHARTLELEERITSAEIVDTSTHPADEIRFGAHVRLQSGASTREIEIVGVDEADAVHGRIAFPAPLARALLGKRVGDVVTLRTPRGEEELEVLAVSYPAHPL